MYNPWLEIPYSDYENHMAEIGQAKVLNDLTRFCLEKYRPGNFALIGCSTGNGLEHVGPGTKNVYAIDINPRYLDILKERYSSQIKNLEVINIDIQIDELPIDRVDLCFMGLILEYVDPVPTLAKVIRTLNKGGVLAIVIQKNQNTSFVTKTRYTTLEKLASISGEVNENEMEVFLRPKNFLLQERKEFFITGRKSLIYLAYGSTAMKYKL